VPREDSRSAAASLLSRSTTLHALRPCCRLRASLVHVEAASARVRTCSCLRGRSYSTAAGPGPSGCTGRWRRPQSRRQARAAPIGYGAPWRMLYESDSFLRSLRAPPPRMSSEDSYNRRLCYGALRRSDTWRRRDVPRVRGGQGGEGAAKVAHLEVTTCEQSCSDRARDVCARGREGIQAADAIRLCYACTRRPRIVSLHLGWASPPAHGVCHRTLVLLLRMLTKQQFRRS